MHFFAPDKNFWGGHGIVAGQTPLGLGLAYGLKYLGREGCCLCYLGDGAVNQGAFHESLNLAALFEIPVVYVIENNGYSMGTSQERSSSYSSCLAQRADAYDIEWDVIDGSDLYEVRAKTHIAMERARQRAPSPPCSKSTPTATTATALRTPTTRNTARPRRSNTTSRTTIRSPCSAARSLAEGVLTEDSADRHQQGRRRGSRRRREIRRRIPRPDHRGHQHRCLLGKRPRHPGFQNRPPFFQRLIHSRNRSPNIFLPFSQIPCPAFSPTVKPSAKASMRNSPATRTSCSWARKSPNTTAPTRSPKASGKNGADKRVVDTPISEAGFIGMGIGASMLGVRPVMELMFWSFHSVAFDQLVSNAACVRYMSGGLCNCPIVVRGPANGGTGVGATHSHVPEALFAAFPGLKVCAPATPADAKGLIKAAIRDNDPVYVMENTLLYGNSGEVPDPADWRFRRPARLGRRQTRRRGHLPDRPRPLGHPLPSPPRKSSKPNTESTPKSSTSARSARSIRRPSSRP